jgi:hypothetical protein
MRYHGTLYKKFDATIGTVPETSYVLANIPDVEQVNTYTLQFLKLMSWSFVEIDRIVDVTEFLRDVGMDF